MSWNIAQVDSSVHIVTPENVSFQYRAAGPFRRLPAYLIDLGIRFGMWIAAIVAASFLQIIGGAAAFGLLLLFWFILEWFYGGLFETFWNGQTPGKRMTGIRVLSVTGQPINGLQAVLRNILRAVDLMPLVPTIAFGLPGSQFAVPTFLVGLATSALSRRYQRMGDLVCGTMVVVEERARLTAIDRIDDSRAHRLAAELPPHFTVDRQLSRALSLYVERRRFFSAARRSEIARHLAVHLLERFRLPQDTDGDLLLCALYVRAFAAEQGDQSELADSVAAEPAQAAVPASISGGIHPPGADTASMHSSQVQGTLQ